MAHGSTPSFNQNPQDALLWDEFDYITPGFDTLQQHDFLPDGADTIAALRALGETMVKDPTTIDAENSIIPAPYTYLGQFIDHDITNTAKTGMIDPDATLQSDVFSRLSSADARSLFRNQRTSGFDLDSLYGSQLPAELEHLAVPFSGDKFDIGMVVEDGPRPPGKGRDNDLPRVPLGAPVGAKLARIGDGRNDENTIIAQLHLAFLKFHNAVVDDGHSFDVARTLVTRHYQWIVLQDFLPRICEPTVVRKVIETGNRLYKPIGDEKFMPFEFATAAYRFGHSMIRSSYDFNLNFLKTGGAQADGRLRFLFDFTAKSGDLGGFPRLPQNWIIEWERMFKDRAMKIDPTLTPFLAALPGAAPTNVMAKLASRNLLKGYLFGLPTGQALAERLLPVTDILNEAEMEAACRPKAGGEVTSQWEVLKAAGMHNRTPLWFYILAEAKAKAGGNHLGPLGSFLVAETIVGLIRANPTSILNQPFLPTLGETAGNFDLQDLLIKAGVMSTRV